MNTILKHSEFAADPDRAIKAAADGPVFIVDETEQLKRVMLSADDYQRMAGRPPSIIEALAMPGLSDIELEIPPRRCSCQDVDFE